MHLTKIRRYIPWIVFFSFITMPSFSQEPADGTVTEQAPAETQVDTIAPQVYVTKAKKGYPNPRTAALLSLVPGGGQIYNKKYWWIKVPVIYGGLIGMGLVVDFNTKQYNSFKNAYLLQLEGKPHEYSDIPALANEAVLKQIRDIYDKRRQQSYIAISAIYIAGIIEAYVSAHLHDFDISEDLSLRIRPEATPVHLGGAGIGASISLQLGK